MLRMRGHVSAAFFRCDALFLTFDLKTFSAMPT